MRFRIPKYFPGWFVSGGGGSGGSGTVSTDGVTIQGNGSGGNPIAIKAVQTAARLSGAGTVASPLDVVGWPLTNYANGGYGATGRFFASTGNKLNIYGVLFLGPVSCSNISIDISTADAVNNYDIGFYNLAGTRIAHIGAQTIPSTGIQTFAFVGAPVSIPMGINFFVTTGTNATAILFISGGGGLPNGFGSTLSTGTSAGGALPATITPPAIAANSETPNYILT